MRSGNVWSIRPHMPGLLRQSFVIKLTCLAILAIGQAAMAAAPPASLDGLIASASMQRPEVKWDRTSFVRVNLTGANRVGSAVIGHLGDSTVVAVSALDGDKGHFDVIDLGSENCGRTPRLEVSALNCIMEVATPVAGCKKNPRSQ